VPRILVISSADAASALRGPGLRARQIAEALTAAGAECDVLPAEGSAAPDARDYDAVVVPQGLVDVGRALARALPDDVPLAVDCYAPALVERLLLGPPGDRHAAGFRERSADLLRRGDCFLVAGPAQRAHVAGQLLLSGRLAPEALWEPPLLETPLALPGDDPPPPNEGGEPVVVWFGSAHPWLDLQTALEACARLRERVPTARLRLIGAEPPASHPLGDGLEAVAGVEHAGRGAALRAGRCAICLSRPGLELELAHRARLLDHIWAGQPFVFTRGDRIGERAAASGAALAVEPGDVAGAASALELLLTDDAVWRSAQAAAVRLRAELQATRPYDPLVAWARAPRRDPLRAAGRRGWV
jgi:hypothetical protein